MSAKTWLLLTVLFVNFLAMPRTVYPGDPFTMREEAIALLESSKLSVNPQQVQEMGGEPGQYFYKNDTNGNFYSKYGIGNSLYFAIPLAFEKISTGELPHWKSSVRVYFLNFFNLFLSLVAASLLFDLATLFVASKKLAVLYVLLVFYSTFLWNYLRAQNTELIQLVLTLYWFKNLFYLYLKGESVSSHRRNIWLAVAALVFFKIYYVLAVPLVIFQFTLLSESKSPGKKYFSSFALETRKNILPATLIILALAAQNYFKFGSIFHTGYDQWRPELASFGHDVRDSLSGLIFGVQFGLVPLFPVLGLSFFAVRSFYFAHKTVWLSVLVAALVLYTPLLFMPAWRGELCFGPRYFLFLLPLLSLPALFVLEYLWRRRSRRVVQVLYALLVSLFGYSTYLQHKVNSYDFILYYKVREPLVEARGVSLGALFWLTRSHYGRIASDLESVDFDVTRLSFWESEYAGYPSDYWEVYRQHVKRLGSENNFLWFPTKE